MKRCPPPPGSRVCHALAALSLAASGALGCETPPAVVDPTVSVDLPPAASATADATKEAPKGPIDPKELWRIEVDGAHPAGVVGDRGELLVAWEFRDRLSLPGGESIPTVGDKDVALTRIGEGGAVKRVQAFGGSLDEELESMAISGGEVALAMTSDSTFTLAGTSLSPGPMPPGGLYPPPASFVAWLGKDDAPVRVHSLAPGANSMVLGAAPDGDVVVGARYPEGDAYFGHSTIQRLGSDGAVRWVKRAPAMALSTIDGVKSGLAVGIREDAGLGLALLDPANGALGEVRRTERASVYGGDLGTISGIVQLGADVLAFGETGRHVVRGRSHTIEPFSLALRGDGKPERRQLADVTGSITGVFRRGAEALFVLWVIHTGALYGGTPLPHRGVYLGVVGATGQPRFTPIYQVAYENDDWEKGEPTVVMGSYLSPSHVHLEGDTLVIAGHCDERASKGCIVAFSLSR